ncbi:tRNA (adenosine(37)-N6)-threonylcarbamoyltransferase complex ATPase subunit type 1 TsaE [Marinomonas sp. M1K-6]|uniref:tRNA threonylcarbamoyladenosine biosynthesis protein TsaE n=1 Tax=Marinomonas profundi TaxID=2726122 RepID=A0A847R3H9_9GAMM|nr:tRNA (adenosine(37)-N6)-threonylcarbamoyltransferase complex ATPase subunit type 1 TsaE [Marinomonas profundi]NLQ18462.1 tRNA (adenosine(37)-N6)-threonylcarbamoyltransferase complex ATPase subunit type 1 TsaE [Marinomonas profundi]UDV02781.1 tRNA (adenosine(37)-N6)-threonylcarbamoyltransferase complex ATPase subunit type 1 TsaE [Marinomonas profundi]
MRIEKEVYGEEAMERLGGSIALVLKNGGVVYLEGDLGMGKTTLVRGVLRGLGYQGPVKSPTYTLVEPYELSGLEVNHFDLYRVADAEELEYMGIRDYFTEGSLCLIEWADMGRGVLPEADWVISLGLIRQGRHVSLEAQTEKGYAAFHALQKVITS